MLSQKFLESLKWILSESGQTVRVDSCATTYIRSLEGDEWCVGTMDNDGSIIAENSYTDVDDAIDDYINRVSNLNDW